jgi:MFS family permease
MPAIRRRRWVSARIGLLSSIGATFLATSSAPTPLYGVYGRLWGLSAATTSVVFGAYALALLAALLVFGRLSEQAGRRRVVWSALAVQVVAMAAFVTADGIGGLLAGRVLQGLSTGVGLAAVGAALLDVDPERGRVANAAAPPVGSAVGALGSAALVAWAPAPTHLVYVVFAVVLVVECGLLLLLPETLPRATAARAPQLRVRVPSQARALLGAALPVVFSVWAVSGLFGALGPRLAAELTGSSSPVLSALPVAIVGVVAPVVALATARLDGRTSLGCGIAALLAALALTAMAVAVSAMGILLLGAAIAGVGFGLGFRGGMDVVLPEVDAAERAGTLSLLYIASYLGFGIPAMVAGVVVRATGNLAATTLGYAAVLAVLALAAAGVLVRTRPRDIDPKGTTA